MKRRDFIIKGCSACLAGSIALPLLSSCGASKMVNGKLNENGILLNKSDFVNPKGGKNGYRSFVIVQHDDLKYPICVYRFDDTNYTALWMQCTHQGAELQVSGDYLQCPAHGSEFNNKGKMINGPADTDLRSFPITEMNDQLFIDLRKA